MKNRKEYQQQSPAVDQMKQELKQIRYKRAYARTLRSTLACVVMAAALILCAVAFLPIIRITGDSMSHTLNRGDILLTLRGDEVQRGDLIVFYVEGNRMLVKRAVAVAGDRVEMTEDGALIVNDQPVDEPYISSRALGECDQEFPLVVPQERVFVLGDHRELSIDSRSSAMGCIAREQVIGKAAVRIWPLNALGLIAGNGTK